MMKAVLTLFDLNAEHKLNRAAYLPFLPRKGEHVYIPMEATNLEGRLEDSWDTEILNVWWQAYPDGMMVPIVVLQYLLVLPPTEIEKLVAQGWLERKPGDEVVNYSLAFS